jgi:WD40 repeat protein
MAWSPEGKHIATGSLDHQVKIWDVTTGYNIFTYDNAVGEVWAVAWSPDSQRTASGSNDHKVRI